MFKTYYLLLSAAFFVKHLKNKYKNKKFFNSEHFILKNCYKRLINSVINQIFLSFKLSTVIKNYEMLSFRILSKKVCLYQIPLSFPFSLMDKILPPTSQTRKFINEFYLICKEGSKETYRDLKYLYSIHKIPESDLNFLELRKKRTITHDLLKLIPFTFFIIVPFSGTMLPAYLFFFPNAIPQRYLKFFLETRKQKFLEKKKENALKELNLAVDLKNMNSDQLINVADSLKLEYFSLTFIISQTFTVLIKTPFFFVNAIFWFVRVQKRLEYNKHWIFNYRFKFNYFPFETLKRRVLLFQIRNFLENVWKEDRKLLEFDAPKLNTLEKEEIKQYLEERGVFIAEDKDWVAEIKQWSERTKNKQIEEFLIIMLENTKKTTRKTTSNESYTK